MNKKARRKQRREAEKAPTERGQPSDGPFGAVPAVQPSLGVVIDPDDIGGGVRIVRTTEQAQIEEQSADPEFNSFRFTLSKFLSMDGPNPFIAVQELGPLHKRREWERARARVSARIVRPALVVDAIAKEHLVTRLAEDSKFFRDLISASMATSFLALDAARDDTVDMVADALGVSAAQLQTSGIMKAVTEDALTDMALIQFIRGAAAHVELDKEDLDALLTKHVFNRLDGAQPGP